MDQLPSYSSPPVVETAIAIQFRPLKDFRNVDIWGFWSQLSDQYPNTRDQEPLDTRTEDFGVGIHDTSRLPRIVARPHASRLQALSKDEHEMVQIQNGRFIYNWRRLEGGDYPRWSKTRPKFMGLYRRFEEYVADRGLGSLVPNQWEVTYVNHLMKGQDWITESDWPNLVPGVLGRCDSLGLGKLEAIDCRLQLTLVRQMGRLYVDLKKAALSSRIEQELLVLTLIARGKVPEDSSPAEGLEVGHEAIVRAFVEITGRQAQAKWGLSQ